MNANIKARILIAAVAAVPLFGLVSTSGAQYRLPQDGRALDANNRVGSNGTNPNDSANRAPVSGNDIVTGNVTGGKQFRGNVPYRNANEFRGNTSGGAIDDFIKQSSSADPNGPGSSYRVQTFYGDARTVHPPANFQPGPIGVDAYVPPPPGGVINRTPADPRLGAIDINRATPILPTPGELLLPGPVDPALGQQYITASPLIGIRQGGINDLGLYSGTVTNTQYNPVTGSITPERVQQMRDEINAIGATELQAQTQAQSTADAAKGGLATPVVQKGIDTSITQATPAGQTGLDTAIAQPGGADQTTNQGVRQRLLVAPVSPRGMVPAQAQSSLYAEMLKRHQTAAQDQSITDAEAARAYNAAVHERQRAESGAGAVPGAVPGAAPAQPAGPAQPAQPGAVNPSNSGAPGAAPSAAPGVTDYAKMNEDLLKNGGKPDNKLEKKPEPVKVQSLASGVKAKGLSELLTNAEDLMKQGKFTSALEQYDQAERVASNNPLIRLGRANAELGASYYARAEAHLREAFTANPELLVGQYDLTALLGENRVGVLVKDLKEIANKDQREARPVFLLAYIAYNTGHEQQAEGYLDLADKRSGGKDPFFALLRKNWSLPANDNK